jgi:hypothetical protein
MPGAGGRAPVVPRRRIHRGRTTAGPPVWRRAEAVRPAGVGSSPSAATARSVVTFASQRLARFKVPYVGQSVHDFPRTPSERVDKRRLVAENCDGIYDDLRPDANRR